MNNSEKKISRTIGLNEYAKQFVHENSIDNMKVL